MERNYEKLERMRDEIKKDKEKIAAMQEQVRAKEAKLREAENVRILSDVTAMKLSPEEIGTVLDLIQAGKIAELMNAKGRGAGKRGKDRAVSPEDGDLDGDFDEEDAEDEA